MLRLGTDAGNTTIVRILLDAGATHLINRAKVTRYQGRTPIQAAAEGGHEAMVRLLLALGADINAPPSPCGGRTALQTASFGGHVEVVRLLISSGADVNARAARLSGYTALQGASQAGEAGVVDILLQSGADVDAPGPLVSGYNGGTALHAAAAGGHVGIVRKLLAAGADPNSKAGPRAQTPMQSAHLIGREDIVGVLVEAGAVGPRGGGKLLFGNLRKRSWSRGEMDREIQQALR